MYKNLVELDLGFKLIKIYAMCKNLMTPAADCLENENHHVCIKLFNQKLNVFKMDPSRPTKLLQEL